MITTIKKLKRSLLLLLFATAPSHAVVDLELTQGLQGAIPIAIVPFAGQPSQDRAPDNVVGVVTSDLQNSGRFRVMDKSDMEQTPNRVDQVDFNYWQKHRMNNIVVGQVQPVGGGRYQVQFQLLDTYAASSAAKNAVLLSQSFTVNSQQLRSLAHHISDLVYEKLTGDRGVFSTRIAYVLAQQLGRGSIQYALEVADMDGYNPKSLLQSREPIMSPAWSPDGKQIAYVSFEQGRGMVYVQHIQTGSRQLVSNFPGLNSAPTWSPDGRKLALVLTRSGYPKIFIMDLHSKQTTQLTQGDSIDTEPTWSSDGSYLVFTSSRSGGPQVYRVNIASGNVQRVTFQGNYNASPSLAPDGKALAVLNGGNNQFNIAVQDLSSGRYSVLTRSGNDQSPSLAPNGKMIIYATQSGGHGVLGMVSTDGRVKLILPAREGDVREPAWSPFST